MCTCISLSWYRKMETSHWGPGVSSWHTRITWRWDDYTKSCRASLKNEDTFPSWHQRTNLHGYVDPDRPLQGTSMLRILKKLGQSSSRPHPMSTASLFYHVPSTHVAITKLLFTWKQRCDAAQVMQSWPKFQVLNSHTKHTSSHSGLVFAASPQHNRNP